MDRNQAKEILARYRPGETWGDPLVGEALEMVRHDPQLAEWFAKRRAEQAGTPVATAADAATKPKREQIPLSKPALFMIAVAGAVVLGLMFWSRYQPKPQSPFNNYRERMGRMVQRGFPMENPTTDPAQVREYFRTNSGPVDFTLPRNLEKLPAKGCVVFPWRGHPVALMALDAGANTNLYLFLIARAVFARTPVPATPEYLRIGRLLTASWTSGDKVYVLAGPDDPAVLQGFVE